MDPQVAQRGRLGSISRDRVAATVSRVGHAATWPHAAERDSLRRVSRVVSRVSRDTVQIVNQKFRSMRSAGRRTLHAGHARPQKNTAGRTLQLSLNILPSLRRYNAASSIDCSQ
jgi:hypothetical protein